MSSVERHKEEMEIYLRSLNLPGNKIEVIKDGMQLLNHLNADEISENHDLVASLFCTIICNCSEKMISDIKMSELIWQGYKNIRLLKVNEGEKPSVEIVVIDFLNKINELCGMGGGHTVPIDNEMQLQFKMLCSKLEEMKAIFRLRYQGIEVFPIGKLLSVVFRENFKFDKLDEATLNTFLLALEIFDTTEYVAEKDKLHEIIDSCNLECLRYLSNPSVKPIGQEVWKENFQYNGVLVLADTQKRLIYIRHPEKMYFKNLGSENLKEERNSSGKEIAYYYEHPYDDSAAFTSIKEIMLTGSFMMKMSMLKEIYNNKHYNSFYSKAFFRIGDRIEIINPFSTQDEFIVSSKENIKEANKENVTNYAIKPYSLLKLCGVKLDFIIIGTIAKLLSICDVDIELIADDLNNVNEKYQDALINSWLIHSDDVYENMLKLQDIYFNDTLYIKNRTEFLKKRYADISWMPFKLPVQPLIDWINSLCSTISDDKKIVEIEVIENFDGDVLFKDGGESIDIGNIVSDNLQDIHKDSVYSIKSNEKYFISESIDCAARLIQKIDDGNKILIDVEMLNVCLESQLQIVIEAMRLQEKALKDIEGYCKDFTFDSIARMRILHHIIFYQIISKENWTSFIELINGHQLLKFDFAATLTELSEENTLIVPKERQDSDSALTSIINEYMRKDATRSHDLYFQEIGLTDEGYTYRNHRIDKIVFLFDTLQSGTSTIRNLKFYFENYDQSVKDNVVNQHIVYHCNHSEIRLEQIIEKNRPKVEVLVLYGSDMGKEKVEAYLATNTCIDEKEVICKEKIEKIADQDFINKAKNIYGSQITIEENNFPIIREFNQPKRNAFGRENLSSEKIASIFVKKKEFT